MSMGEVEAGLIRRVGIPRETSPGERRVALTPRFVSVLSELQLEVLVERHAGRAAGFEDAAYRAKGARICSAREDVFRNADLIAQVRTIPANPVAGGEDLPQLRPGQVVVGFAHPFRGGKLLRDMAKKKVLLFAMEMVPRVSRAQSMDALSAMATVAGYKAVVLAAERLPKMFPMLVTAAGTIPPARVLVIGAGVAGLQAIATARRLGARVKGYDLRPAARDDVSSLGAEFVELPLPQTTTEVESGEGYALPQSEGFYQQQRKALAQAVAESDVVITTAAIPGDRAPILITRAMVERMAPGSVILDLAAETGGNCEYTRADEVAHEAGVTILGPTNLPSTVAYHASEMYAKNVSSFIRHLLEHFPFPGSDDDSILTSMLLTNDGRLVHPALQGEQGVGPIGEDG